MHIKP